MTKWRKLPPLDRALLERIDEHTGDLGPLLVSQIIMAGNVQRRRLERLIAGDLVKLIDHPTVMERTHVGRGTEHAQRPAQAVEITPAGKHALLSEK